MAELCKHMLEREIQHWSTGRDELTRRTYHKAGDAIALVCPHGCDPILVNVVPNAIEDKETE